MKQNKKKQEKLYEKTIYDLFYIKLNKRYHLRDNYVNLSDYEKNIKSNVKNININCNEKFIKDKYAYYIKIFERLKNGENIRITLTNIGFYSRYNTKKEYYIDRGWDNVAIDTFIKQRQSRQLSQESKKKWTETWHNNREKNIVSLKKGNVICKDYYKEKFPNMTDNEIEQCISKEQSNRSQKMYKRLKDNGIKKITNTCVEYWTKRGFTISDAIQKVSDRQNTVSLERYIERYGIDVGKQKYDQRIAKYKLTMSSKTDEEKLEILKKKLYRQNFYSRASFNFFKEIEKTLLNKGLNIKCKYGEREYYIYDNKTNRIYFYDFYIKELNYIIEYNGSIWHPNKEKLSNNEWKNWLNPVTKKTADECYSFDMHKLSLLSERNLIYDIVWDTDCVNKKIKEITSKITKLYESKQK